MDVGNEAIRQTAKNVNEDEEKKKEEMRVDTKAKRKYL